MDAGEPRAFRCHKPLDCAPAAGRQQPPPRTPGPSPSQVEAIRALFSQGNSLLQLGRIYHLSDGELLKIIRDGRRGGGQRRLGRQGKKQLLALRKEGLSIAEIARRLGVSDTCVHWHLKRLERD